MVKIEVDEDKAFSYLAFQNHEELLPFDRQKKKQHCNNFASVLFFQNHL